MVNSSVSDPDGSGYRYFRRSGSGFKSPDPGFISPDPGFISPDPGFISPDPNPSIYKLM